MSTEDLSAERAAYELHSAIMNIPSAPEVESWPQHRRIDYKMGHRDARHAAAELVQARASSAAAVPAGWKLVPVEPTKEMSDAAYKAHGYPGGNAWAYQAAYRTMLAATPAPPQADHFPDAGKMVPPQAVPATDAKAVATVTECEACFTPDACQLRGTCDHYAAERLRVAPAAPVTVDAADVPEADFGELADEDIETMLPVIRHRSGCVNYAAYTFGDVAFAVRAALRAVGAGSREPLTDAEIDALWDAETVRSEDRSLPRRWLRFARAIEAAHGIAARGKA